MMAMLKKLKNSNPDSVGETALLDMMNDPNPTANFVGTIPKLEHMQGNIYVLVNKVKEVVWVH